MSHAFKYQELLVLTQNCPPSNYREVSMKAFRFIHYPSEHPDNFVPVQLQNPSRKFDDDEARCKALGLSFFDDKGKAILFFRKRVAKFQRFAKIVGERIATISVSPEDGKASAPEETNFGHFTFHEYVRCDFHQKIDSVEPIKKQ